MREHESIYYFLVGNRALLRQASVKRQPLRVPVVFDVGCANGKYTIPYLRSNYLVYGFEPNSYWYGVLDRLVKTYPRNLKLIRKAVDVETGTAKFYRGPTEGTSSLRVFTDDHTFKAEVETISLKQFMIDQGLNHVNYLKIDTEGNDFRVLQSYPWEKSKPEILMCEFENKKTVQTLGHDWRDQAEFLHQMGYHVLVSEFKPIVKYGGNHHWVGLKEYPCQLDDENAWGNFIAVRDEEAYKRYRKIIRRRYKTKIK